MEDSTGLRERKKAATRLALHEAALRLAVERGLDRVTVEAIADAANVSRRTFSNYFAGKEEALFHGDAMRLRRMLQLIHDHPVDESPWTVLVRSAERLTVEMYGDIDPAWLAQRQQLRRHPSLVVQQAAVYAAIERELAAELVNRLTGPDVALRARVLAATFLAVFRVAVQHWLDHPDHSLPDVVRAVLTEATPSATTTYQGIFAAPERVTGLGSEGPDRLGHAGDGAAEG